MATLLIIVHVLIGIFLIAVVLLQTGKAGNIADLRSAPKDSPFAYGAWKGYLAAHARDHLPPTGAYEVELSNEIHAVIVEALEPVAGRVIRGR